MLHVGNALLNPGPGLVLEILCKCHRFLYSTLALLARTFSDLFLIGFMLPRCCVTPSVVLVALAGAGWRQFPTGPLEHVERGEQHAYALAVRQHDGHSSLSNTNLRQQRQMIRCNPREFRIWDFDAGHFQTGADEDVVDTHARHAAGKSGLGAVALRFNLRVFELAAEPAAHGR